MIQFRFSKNTNLILRINYDIDDYLQEVGNDSDLFDHSEDGKFTAKVYPEFPLNLDTDHEGNLTETKETKEDTKETKETSTKEVTADLEDDNKKISTETEENQTEESSLKVFASWLGEKGLLEVEGYEDNRYYTVFNRDIQLIVEVIEE